MSPGSGELFDRVRVSTQPFEKVGLAPTINLILDGAKDDFLYAPGSTGFVTLAGPLGDALVDEDAAITGALVTQTGWDRFTLGALATGFHQLTVTAGTGVMRAVTLEVGHADGLVHVLGDDLVANERRAVCFGARSGARGIHVAWRFEAEGGTVEDAGLAGCVNVFAGTTNEVTLHAFADGLSTSVTLPVVASRRRDAALLPPLSTSDTASERAAMH